MNKGIFFIIFLLSIPLSKAQAIIFSTETLKIERLTEKVFVHTSYMEIPGFGKFPANGMIYFNEDEAVVFDTPVDEPASEELIHWVKNIMKKEISAVVVNHFHEDCMGGLQVFHQEGIPSYASDMTIRLAKARHTEHLPEESFDRNLVCELGMSTIVTGYYGPGHTMDNMVTYIPTEKVLFGGCLVKEIGAGKGNLEDANILEWPKTVNRVRKKYPDVEYVIPGHGKTGGKELLDYTIKLFE